jgi:hypothetical protein
MSRTVGQKVIQWTWDEQRMLAQICLNEMGKHPKMELLDALKEAQKSLPPARQRNLRQKSNISSKLEQFMVEIKAKPHTTGVVKPGPSHSPKPTVADPVIPPSPVFTEGFKLQDQGEPIPPVERRFLKKEATNDQPSLEDQLVDVLSSFLVKVVRETAGRLNLPFFEMPPAPSPVVQPPAEAPAPVMSDILAKVVAKKHNPEMSSKDKPKLPNVLVVGFKGFQWKELEKAAAGRLAVKFWESDGVNGSGGLKSLAEKAKNADHILLNIDFIGHSAGNTIENVGKKYLRISGATSQAIKAITSLADTLEGVE